MTVKTTVENSAKQSGLDFLIEKFSSLETVPPLPDICGWLAEAEITGEEIEPYRQFSVEKYTRNRIFRNEFVELLVLGWLPGQDTLIHDHDGSHGAVRVFEGVITETKFRLDEDKKLAVGATQEVSAGLIAGVSEPDIHKLGNFSKDGQNSISIHVYAPPLKKLHIYEVGSSEIRIYQLD